MKSDRGSSNGRASLFKSPFRHCSFSPRSDQNQTKIEYEERSNMYFQYRPALSNAFPKLASMPTSKILGTKRSVSAYYDERHCYLDTTRARGSRKKCLACPSPDVVEGTWRPRSDSIAPISTLLLSCKSLIFSIAKQAFLIVEVLCSSPRGSNAELFSSYSFALQSATEFLS